jgi:hypothetical protein
MKKHIAILLALGMSFSIISCTNRDSKQGTIATSTVIETSKETTIESTTESSTEETNEIVKEAAVAKEDIVYVNMEGMSAEEVIKNLSNLTKNFDKDWEKYGDRFEVKAPSVYTSVIPKTNMAPNWYFDTDKDGRVSKGVTELARISRVGYTAQGMGEDGLIVEGSISKDIADEVKSALLDKLLATGAVVASDDGKVILAHPANDISANYYITMIPYNGFISFKIEVPCRALA